MHTNYTFENPIVLSVKLNHLLLFSELTVIDFVVKRLAFLTVIQSLKRPLLTKIYLHLNYVKVLVRMNIICYLMVEIYGRVILTITILFYLSEGRRIHI